jgi:Fis family transcriptional regulator, factor for inversion stimulation protein
MPGLGAIVENTAKPPLHTI